MNVTVEHFESMSHEQIYAAVQRMDPQALAQAENTWRTVADALHVARTACHAEIVGAIEHGWTGATADAAKVTLTQFGDAGHRAEEMMAAVATKLGQAAHAAEAMRTAVPPPTAPLETTPESILNPGHAEQVAAHHAATEQARQQAVRAMTAVYGPVFAATATPTFASAGDTHHNAGDQPAADVTPAMSGLGMGMLAGLAGAAAAGNDSARSNPTPRPVVRDEEPEHPAPTYLVEMDQHNPLIGHQAPVSPPVLGVWAEQE